MADKLELILEAERRGILPDDKKALLAEARKRGIVPPADNKPIASAGPKVPQYAADQTGEFNLNDPAQAQRAEAFTQQQRLEETAREMDAKRIANRNIPERVGDALAFTQSVIPRIVTGGKYGAGDIYGLVHKDLGRKVSESERDFVAANEEGLNAIKAAGDVSMGIPALNTLGAPLKAMGPAIAAIKASPRGTAAGAIRGAGETLEKYARSPGAVAGEESAFRLPAAAGRMGQNLQAYASQIKPPTAKQTLAPPAMRGLPENIQTIPERLADIQAFRELELQPFGPATGSRGTARYARTLEEIPIIGGTVSSPKANVQAGAQAAQESIARQLGAEASQEATGAMVQRGLDRYRSAGLEDLPPGDVRQIRVAGPQGQSQNVPRPTNIEPYQPVRAAEALSEPAAMRQNPATLEGGIIAGARAANAGGMATTSRGAQVTAARPLNQIGLRRTNAQDLSDTELAGIIKAPSRNTSFATRGEALYESAFRKIPELRRADGSVNPNQIPTVNMGRAIDQVIGQVGSQIAGQNTIRGELAQMLANRRANLMFSDLRAIRTEVGRALGNFGQFDVGLDRSQLNALYSAATKDMEYGLRDIANRAWRDVARPPGDPARISADVARRADAALYEFRRADRYYRQGKARMDGFLKVLGAENANEAVRKISTALKERTANPAMLRSIAGVLRPEELNALRGHIIEGIGKGRPGSKAAESGFNFNNWATDFHAIMDGPGKKFMTDGLPEAAARRLENLARVVNRMKYYEQTTNYSGSAYTGLLGAGAMSMSNPGSIPWVIGAVGAMGLSGKLLTSPGFLAWQEALMKAQLKVGNTAASNARIAAQYARRLPALAKASKAKDPELARGLQALAIEMDSALKANEKGQANARP